MFDWCNPVILIRYPFTVTSSSCMSCGCNEINSFPSRESNLCLRPVANSYINQVQRRFRDSVCDKCGDFVKVVVNKYA